MGSINVGRLILGGVVAAIVLFVIDYVLNGIILASQWEAAMAAMNLPMMAENAGTIIGYAVLNLIGGLTAVWIYAGIRPRFGPGATTAVYAGLAVWLVSFVIPHGFFLIAGIFPASLNWILLIVGVIEVPVATVAGAYLYKEE
jgi:hypothetical protein